MDIIARGPSLPSGAVAQGCVTPHPNADSTQPVTLADVRKHIALIAKPPVRRAITVGAPFALISLVI
jgi:hypothetical protein